MQEGDGISPTAIREIMLLRELKHDNIVHLDAVHLYRPVLAWPVAESGSFISVNVCAWPFSGCPSSK